MYEAIIGSIYGLSSFIKNKFIVILLMLSGVVYLFFNNYINFSFISYVDFNVIFVFIGSYYLSDLFIKTNVVNLIFNSVFEKTSSYKVLVNLIVIISFFLSCFINKIVLFGILFNVISNLCLKNGFDSSFIMKNVLISSVLGSVSSLVGSDFSLFFSSLLNFNFLDFFFYDSRIGIFFISLFMLFVQLFYVNYFIKDEYFNGLNDDCCIENEFNIYLFVCFIFVLLISSLFDFKYLSGIFSLIFICVGYFKNKCKLSVDFKDIVILILLFIYIGLLKNMSFIEIISNYFVNIKSSSLIYSLFFVLAIILSIFLNPIFVFGFLFLLIPNIVINSDLVSMPLVYSVYFGLIYNCFRKYKCNYLCYIILFCLYVIIAFLYF